MGLLIEEQVRLTITKEGGRAEDADNLILATRRACAGDFTKYEGALQTAAAQWLQTRNGEAADTSKAPPSTEPTAEKSALSSAENRLLRALASADNRQSYTACLAWANAISAKEDQPTERYLEAVATIVELETKRANAVAKHYAPRAVDPLSPMSVYDAGVSKRISDSHVVERGISAAMRTVETAARSIGVQDPAPYAADYVLRLADFIRSLPPVVVSLPGTDEHALLLPIAKAIDELHGKEHSDESPIIRGGISEDPELVSVLIKLLSSSHALEIVQQAAATMEHEQRQRDNAGVFAPVDTGGGHG